MKNKEKVGSKPGSVPLTELSQRGSYLSGMPVTKHL